MRMSYCFELLSILNPWGQSFLLTKDLIKLIIQVDKEGSAL